jgi:hypothetical protein
VCAARPPSSGLSNLAREFPSVTFEVETDCGGVAGPLPTINLAKWDDHSVDLGPFDEHVEALARRERACLVVLGPAQTVTRQPK